MPGVFCQLQFDAVRSFLTAMGYTTMPTFICFVTAIAHFGWCLLLVPSWGIKGIATATLITYASNLIGAHLYVHYYIHKHKERNLQKAWFWPDTNTFVDMRSYAALALNCSVLMVLQWWAFEIIAITSIYFGVLQNGAHALMLTYIVVFYVYPLGFSTAA